MFLTAGCPLKNVFKYCQEYLEVDLPLKNLFSFIYYYIWGKMACHSRFITVFSANSMNDTPMLVTNETPMLLYHLILCNIQ